MTHTLDVRRDDVYVLIEGNLYRTDSLTIYGQLKWEQKQMLYCVMEKVARQAGICWCSCRTEQHSGADVGVYLLGEGPDHGTQTSAA